LLSTQLNSLDLSLRSKVLELWHLLASKSQVSLLLCLFLVSIAEIYFSATYYTISNLAPHLIDDITLFEDTPGNKVTTEQLFAGKKVVLFGLPGAFTPGCSRTHLPGYIADAEKFKAKGVDEVVCVTINDAFVTGAWKAANNADGKVRVLADQTAGFTKALGVELDLSGPFGVHGLRSKRYSAYVVDGEIKVFNIEPDNTGLTCSLSNSLLNEI
jgi:2-Cys peroxiredoxin 5